MSKTRITNTVSSHEMPLLTPMLKRPIHVCGRSESLVAYKAASFDVEVNDVNRGTQAPPNH